MIAITIDIKPGEYPNFVNTISRALLRVAIYSTEGFDATQLDPATIRLTGAPVATRARGQKYLAHIVDINADGLNDLLVQFETQSLDLSALADGWATLTAETYSGEECEGQDEIVLIPRSQIETRDWVVIDSRK